MERALPAHALSQRPTLTPDCLGGACISSSSKLFPSFSPPAMAEQESGVSFWRPGWALGLPLQVRAPRLLTPSCPSCWQSEGQLSHLCTADGEMPVLRD